MPTQSSRFTHNNQISDLRVQQYVLRNDKVRYNKSLSPQSHRSDHVRFSYINSDIR